MERVKTKAFKSTKGVTLIALVVTIIVLLILAGVSIAMLTGNNGILTQGKRAKEEQVHSAVEEGIMLLYNEYVTEKNVKSSDVSYETKIASTEIVKLAETEGTTENLATFKTYIENKNIINESGIINVEKLLGQKQSLGNGTSIDTGDVYVFEEKNEVYSIKYYNKKKEDLLIKQFKEGSLEEETWEATDPSLFEISDDGTISVKDYNSYYYERLQWPIENIVIPKEINGIVVKKIDAGFFRAGATGGPMYVDFNIKSVKIPNTVIEIGNEAFLQCRKLEKIELSEKLVKIGSCAFYHCSGLTNITIPNSVKSIGNSAFEYCSGLTNITIPNSVTSIEDDVFYGCSGLTNITIPNSVTSIGYGAFRNCSGLTSITIPKSVTSIDGYAFDGCDNLKNVYYTGKKSDWSKISISDGNDALTNATKVYEYTPGN